MINISIPVAGVIDEIILAERTLKEKLCRTIFSDLVAATPSDTGRARASWNMDDTGSESELPPGNYAYPQMPNVPKSDNVFIYNTAEYIVFLNNGHSQQAPSMFIELAVENAVGRVNGL